MASATPPESDVGLEDQVKRLDEEIKKLQAQRKRDAEEMKATLDGQRENIEQLQNCLAKYKEFKRMYNDMGGEDVFYVNIYQLLPKLREQFQGDPKKLEELEKWAKEAKYKGRVRVALTSGAACASGAIVGAGGVGVHAALGGLSIAAAFAGPAGVIVIGAFTGGFLVIALSVIGAYTLYQWYMASKKQKSIHENPAITLGYPNLVACPPSV